MADERARAAAQQQQNQNQNPSTSGGALGSLAGVTSFLSGRRGLPGSVRALRAAVTSVVAPLATTTATTAATASSEAVASPAAAAALDVGRRRGSADFFFDSAAPSSSNQNQQQQQREASPPPPTRSASEPRVARFDALINPTATSNAAVDLRSLRELAWSGVPARLRGTVWKLLLGYLPAERSRRKAFLARKRAEYAAFIPAHYEGAAAAGAAVRGGGGNAPSSTSLNNQDQNRRQSHHQASSSSSFHHHHPHTHLSEEAAALRQVQVDAPRTAPGVALFAREDVQAALVRMLYIWGVRHPASGYVQGINDLATPLLAAFFADAASGDGDGVGTNVGNSDNGGGGGGGSGNGSGDFNDITNNSSSSSLPLLSPDDPAWAAVALPVGAAEAAEADAYWCLCRLLEGVQDHYTHGQPGIRRCARAVDELVRRVDAELARHLREENVECLQFAFRWANCLLAREMPLGAAMRLFDTLVAEGASGVAAVASAAAGVGGAPAAAAASMTANGGGTFFPSASSSSSSLLPSGPSTAPLSSSSLAEFLSYACASFLVGWREELLRLDFQGAVMFLQRPPTARWSEADVEPVLARAFLWRAQFGGAPSHLGRR